MAGVYTDIPGTRFALDQDGSVLKWRDYTASSAWTDITGSLVETQKVTTSTYAGMLTSANFNQFALAFPEARDISGIYIHFGTSDPTPATTNYTWEYSTNTTDGTDGAWSTFSCTFTNQGQHDQSGDATKPFYRSDIASVSLTNVRGIRLRCNNTHGWGVQYRLFVMHIYGNRPVTGVDRLAFWHPTLDQAISAAYLDFGDTPQGTVVTRQFRVKNLSAALTANTVSIAGSDLLPEYTAGELQVSTDNVTYANSVSIGNLAANTSSSTLYVRMTVPAAESPSQRSARLLVNATSWT